MTGVLIFSSNRGKMSWIRSSTPDAYSYYFLEQSQLEIEGTHNTSVIAVLANVLKRYVQYILVDNQEYCLFMDVYSDLKPTPCMLICRLTKEETLWTSGALQKGECEE